MDFDKMVNINVKCPHCGGDVEAFNGLTGKELVCVKCGATKELPIIKEPKMDLGIEDI